jgi:hypothetical protein
MTFIDRGVHYYAWAPGAGQSSRPILVALREAGFLAQIGSRRAPAGNFEVRCFAAERQTTVDIITAVDPAARPLSVGR